MPAKIFHAEFYGTRASKFTSLEGEADWREVQVDPKMFYFVPKNREGDAEYATGFGVDELFGQNVTGIVTMGDSFAIADDKEILARRIEKLTAGEYAEPTLNHEFGLGKNYAKWIIDNQKDIRFDGSKLARLNYRPFDERWTYFDNKIIWRWRVNVMRHFVDHENIGLLFKRGGIEPKAAPCYVSKAISESRAWSRPGMQGVEFIAPLYLYVNDGSRVPESQKRNCRGN